MPKSDAARPVRRVGHIMDPRKDDLIVLTAPEAAEALGLTERELWAKVDAGAIPAPDRFRKGKPLYNEETIANPEPRVRRPGKGMRREDHIMNLYDEVAFYALKHGDANVPQRALGRTDYTGKPFPLGDRVSALRIARKRGKLSRREVALFTALPGWTWDYGDTQWRLRYQSVVSRYPDQTTEADRIWLSIQRNRFEQLRPDWQRMLTEIDGLLDVSTHIRARLFTEAAVEWLNQHPGKTMEDVAYATVVETADGPYKLGVKMTYYRRRYRGLEGAGKTKLSSEDAALIESLPGWKWEMRPRGGHNSKGGPRTV